MTKAQKIKKEIDSLSPESLNLEILKANLEL
jgi:hypothetical protein